MANAPSASNTGGETTSAGQCFEDDVSLLRYCNAAQSIPLGAICVCVVLRKDKGVGSRGSIDRRGEVLFIDAREVGL